MAVTIYPSPRRSWIDITAADVTAGLACPGQLVAAFANNDQYLHDIMIGRDSDFSAENIPHDHVGANERPVAPLHTFNYLINSAPFGGQDVEDVRGDWHYDRRASKVTTDGFLFNGVGGAQAWQYLPPKGSEEGNDDQDTKFFDIARCVYGVEAKLTVSCYARLAEAPTGTEQDQGMISFGVTDGDASYLEGCRATFHWSDFSSTTWKRFYSFITVGDIKNGARFVVRQAQQATVGCYVTAMMVSPGHRLGYWQPARLDKARSGAEHFAFYGYGIESCPVAEYATSISGAVRLYPV